MIVQLDAKHRICGAEHCWELQRLHVVKGKSRWRAYKYFPSFRLAVQHAAHDEIRTAPVEGLAESIETVERVVARYSAVIDDAIAQLSEQAESKLRSVS